MHSHMATRMRTHAHTHTHEYALPWNHWAPETKALSCSGEVLSLIHTALGAADSRHTLSRTHCVAVCEREIQHTQGLDLGMHTYTHTHTILHGHRQWCCIAAWLGVKAKQSYWRQVGERRWLTKPNHTWECCLEHLTARPLCVCVCVYFLTYM